MMLNQISLPSRASSICSVVVFLFSELLPHRMLTGIDRYGPIEADPFVAESGIACAMGFAATGSNS